MTKYVIQIGKGEMSVNEGITSLYEEIFVNGKPISPTLV